MSQGPTPEPAVSVASVDLDASERARRRQRLALFTAAAAAILAGGLFLLYLVMLSPQPAWGFDLEAYLDAARRLARGDLARNLSIYDADTLAGPFRPGPYKLFLYSPPFAAGMLPFTAVSIDSAAIAWYLGRLALLALACA